MDAHHWLKPTQRVGEVGSQQVVWHLRRDVGLTIPAAVSDEPDYGTQSQRLAAPALSCSPDMLRINATPTANRPPAVAGRKLLCYWFHLNQLRTAKTANTPQMKAMLHMWM